MRICRADLNEVVSVVDAMMARVQSRQAPCGMTGWPTLRGARLMLPWTGERVAPAEVRARYARRDPTTAGEISLEHLPRSPEQIDLFLADLDAMRVHLVTLLVHEVAHARQVQMGGDEAEPLREQAEALSKKLLDGSKAYEDYMAYVSHPIETAAHAAQLAAEVFLAAGGELEEAAFRQSCETTWLAWRLRDDLCWEPPPGPSRAATFEAVWSALVTESWPAYGRLH